VFSKSAGLEGRLKTQRRKEMKLDKIEMTYRSSGTRWIVVEINDTFIIACEWDDLKHPLTGIPGTVNDNTYKKALAIAALQGWSPKVEKPGYRIIKEKP
jgi:hypothetical protein